MQIRLTKVTAGLSAAFILVFTDGVTCAQQQPQQDPKNQKGKTPPPKSAPGQPGGVPAKVPGVPGIFPGGASHPPGTQPGHETIPGHTTPPKETETHTAKPGTAPEKTAGTEKAPATHQPDTATHSPDKPATHPTEPATHNDKPLTPAQKPGVQPGNAHLADKPGTEKALPSGAKPTPPTTHPAAPKPQLTQKTTANGGYEKTAPSGAVREKMEKKPDGEHVTHISPTGRVDKEVVHKADGSQHTIQYAASGKVSQEVVVKPDNTKEVTTHQVGRGGVDRGQETVHYDASGKAVSKKVVVNNNLTVNNNRTVVNNTTIVRNNTTIVNNTTVVERNYVYRRYGYVYEPRPYVYYRPLFVSWYDPYWYSGGVVVVHPFHFTWGWEAAPWYTYYHTPYFVTYPVYPTPAYWVTDWMVAGYVADHYAASVSVAQAHEEARQAQEEAQKAREAADKAHDQAEIAEAKQAAAEAQLRAERAEERAVRAERMEAAAGKPCPTATPIDKETKEQLKIQIETTIAEKKELAEQAEKTGQPVLPDLSKTLADPKHIYPVSKTTSVILAKDSSPAGVISEGDLLRMEPGQEGAIKEASENTFIVMRVMTSKGEEGEVVAGTLISVSLKDVQEFDNEFRAKLDQGLAEAAKNQDAFKKGA